jgi:TonB family protein
MDVNRGGHRSLVALGLALVCSIATVVASQPTTAPRLRDAAVPLPAPEALGGGEVIVELSVAIDGSVASVQPLRTTPPFTQRLVDVVAKWRFTNATTVIDSRVTAVPYPVLVIGAFRAPTLYAGPALGGVAETRGVASARLPQLQSVLMPSYPPRATGDGFVIIEIEMTRFAVPREYRVITPASGFDSAALSAVRAWRFTPPATSDVADRVFVYALVGFRSPVTR